MSNSGDDLDCGAALQVAGGVGVGVPLVLLEANPNDILVRLVVDALCFQATRRALPRDDTGVVVLTCHCCCLFSCSGSGWLRHTTTTCPKYAMPCLCDAQCSCRGVPGGGRFRGHPGNKQYKDIIRAFV